jgi:transcriptional regulator with PAS, ATPase and Fis domain
LNVIPLHIPPLRERDKDIIPMARHMLNQISQDASIAEVALDRQTEKAMVKYEWPGNARELSNVLERILSSLNGDIIHLCDLPFYLYRSKKQLPGAGKKSLKNIQASAEREAIRYALESSGYNKAQAANMLGIHRTLLYKKMKKYHLSLNRN